MNYKKSFILLSVLILSFVIFGCSNKESGGEDASIKNETQEIKYEDRTYTYESADFDDYGWKGYVKVVVEGNMITYVEFDYFDKDGNLKTKADTYNQKMKEKSNIDFLEASFEFEDMLLKTNDIEKVDQVAGATYAYKDFKEFTKKALKIED